MLPTEGWEFAVKRDLQPSAVVPGEHVLGVMGFQQAVAAKVTKDPLADGVLEPFEELGCETGGEGAGRSR